ncbi:MAG: MFS transporter [Deltaproteobacteria bacterium]|nr:MFS transporter [Deltaproteobacteria bacterium]
MSDVSLWRHADFLRLWAAQAISAYGSRITRTALPIIAIAMLDQSESIIGLLVTLQLAPGVILALFAGGFIDRGNKRRILIAADLIRAGAVASLTVSWAIGLLSVAQLIVVGAVVGACSALFAITDNAYLPALIGKAQLAEGNAKIEATEAIAEITGPASAGVLIAALGAPLTVAIDAATYLWSAFMLHQIKTRDVAPVDEAPTASMAASMRGSGLRVGMRAVFRHPIVRPIVISHMVWSLSGGFFMALYTPFCLRVLDLDTATFGVVIAMGGIGSLGGALLSRVFVRVFGLGRTLVMTSALSLLCALFIPLADGPFVAIIAFLIAHQLLSDGFSVAFVIQAVTLRQTVLRKEILGRANAAIHVVTASLLPIGALIGGFLAEAVGTRNAVWVGVLIGLAAPLLLLPLWKVKEMPSGPS